MATISGDGEPNELRGTAGSDFIYGGGGDDYIDGRGGGDNLYGGGNGDYIAVFTSDAAYGDGGNDTLGTVGSPMVLSGGDGNDTIAMQSTTNLSNTVIQGIEVLSLYSTLYLRADQCGTIPKFTSYGRTGHIILTEGGTAQLELDRRITRLAVVGTDDDETVTVNLGFKGTLDFSGNDGNDRADGGAGKDILDGGGGRDTLFGVAGNDYLFGGVSEGALYEDFLFGGSGNDYLRMAEGDRAFGEADDDVLGAYGDGIAVADGGSGNDILRVEYNSDLSATELYGLEQLNLGFGNNVWMTLSQLGSFAIVSGYSRSYGSGTVRLTEGGEASVTLSRALTGEFTLFGSGQADDVTFNRSYEGAITFLGYGGNDKVVAARGIDLLDGGAGDDTLIGREGADILIGGAGSDTFQYTALDHSTADALDRINGFDIGSVLFPGDRIDVSRLDADITNSFVTTFVFGSTAKGGLWVTEEGGYTVVRGNVNDTADAELVIWIDDGSVTASDYSAANFIL